MSSTTTPNTVLITGSTGLLGRAITTAFHRASWSVTPTGLTRAAPPIVRLDLLSPPSIAAALSAAQPSVVVHCAANRNPTSCALSPAAAHALNVTASRALAAAAAARGAHMVYISTDYVFAGAPGEAPYEVDAAPAPGSEYGRSKLEGERAVREAYEEAAREGGGGVAVVLRVPLLYGKAETPGESAVNGLVEAVWRAQGEAVRMDGWARRFPTNTEDVGRVVVDIATHYSRAAAAGEAAGLPPILHFSAKEAYTKYEMCEVFAGILGLGMGGMERDTKGNEEGGVQRPYDCQLSTRALRELGIEVHTVDFRGWWRWELNAVRR